MKYRKKPVVIEAIQWKENTTEIIQFCGNKCSYNANDTAWEVGKGIPNEELIIHTLEGDMIASRNDYIIKGIKGEVCPCKPDIFEKTYEEVGGMNVLEKILEEIEERVNFRECLVKYEKRRGTITDVCRNKGALEELDIIAEIIRSHMDEAADDWIPVEERLPEGGEKVLVWYEYFRYGEYNRMFQTHGIGWQYDGHWSGDVSGTKARCIAWRPLPEPYKPENRNNNTTKEYQQEVEHLLEEIKSENGYVRVSDLAKRFEKIDHELFKDSSWNLLQILSNINILVPEHFD